MKYIIWIATIWLLGQGYIKAIDRFDYHSVRKKVYIEGVELLLNYLKKLQVFKIKKIISHKQNKYSNNFYDVIDEKKMKFVTKLLNEGKYKYQK